jgi:serine/threonine-protein kinase
MEYIDGPNLLDYARAKRLSHAEIARMTAAVAEVVSFLHSRGMVHGQLNPSKILIDSSGNPHVTGYLRHAGATRRLHQDLSQDQLWSLSYYGPEALRGSLSPQSDIWSIGVVLYELITRKSLYEGVTAAQELVERIQHQNSFEGLAVREIPDTLRTICARCLSRLVERRYATAAELSYALRNWDEGGKKRWRFWPFG